jgi:hypothetical protein
MHLTLSFLYALAASVSICLAYDFYKAKDGVLRLILIQLFLTIGARYTAFFFANAYNAPMTIRLIISSIAIPFEIIALVRLWKYSVWK